MTDPAAPRAKPYFLLVHGAWHGAWCFAPLIESLARLGLDAGAVDLPGHGLDARLPRAFVIHDPQALRTETSLATDITADAVVDHLVRSVLALRRAGRDRIILVGHSLGGLAITAAAEALGSELAALVYLAAFMLPPHLSLMTVLTLPENEGALVSDLIVADPIAVGAQRIDPKSTDEAYRQKVRAAFYPDVGERLFEAALFNIIPDEPLALLAVKPTAERWGALPRAYVLAEKDQAILPALQRRMIHDIDQFTPDNATVVRAIPTGHSPFLSAPDMLADVLKALVS